MKRIIIFPLKKRKGEIKFSLHILFILLVCSCNTKQNEHVFVGDKKEMWYIQVEEWKKPKSSEFILDTSFMNSEVIYGQYKQKDNIAYMYFPENCNHKTGDELGKEGNYENFIKELSCTDEQTLFLEKSNSEIKLGFLDEKRKHFDSNITLPLKKYDTIEIHHTFLLGGGIRLKDKSELAWIKECNNGFIVHNEESYYKMRDEDKERKYLNFKGKCLSNPIDDISNDLKMTTGFEFELFIDKEFNHPIRYEINQYGIINDKDKDAKSKNTSDFNFEEQFNEQNLIATFKFSIFQKK